LSDLVYVETVGTQVYSYLVGAVGVRERQNPRIIIRFNDIGQFFAVKVNFQASSVIQESLGYLDFCVSCCSVGSFNAEP
jgi:hypothetical protein